jgi:dipeptidyl aminopeptidase/acylaminoacyl peptidase
VAAESLTLDDLFSEDGVRDVAISPDGRYLAAVVRQANFNYLRVQDLQTGQSKTIAKLGLDLMGPKFEAQVAAIYWKSDDRLLFRLYVMPTNGAQVSWGALRKLGVRLFAIDRDGSNLVRLLAGNKENELNAALNLGAIGSMLPRDADNILMFVDGLKGRSLFRVNVRTGEGTVVESANPAVLGWWIDLDGKPQVRVEESKEQLRFYRREDDDQWKLFRTVPLKEMRKATEDEEYQLVGPSDQRGKFYVLARPKGAERTGIYLYDLENDQFGAPVAENADFDIDSAAVSRDGKAMVNFCYVAHVRVCELADVQMNERMKNLRHNFNDAADVRVVDASNDARTMLLYVEGPSRAPAYYYYVAARSELRLVGLSQTAMSARRMPTASLVEYAAADGKKITGYLTRPPGAERATRLPLVVMPHGGPEARDHLTFDLYAQYFAARGYAVFQPNFRGSDGFGRSFAESGHGQWGGDMQTDIDAGIARLVATDVVDPARICIVGASYGGYAALAGATLTPDLYRCAVSIAGISDLENFLEFKLRTQGSDSEYYKYWVRQIGDPKGDAVRIAAVSPALHANKVKAPILLVHGDADEIVPYAQSEEMQRALGKAGHKTRLIRIKDEGHSEWSAENERTALESIDAFLQTHLGAGYLPPAGSP